jgi:diguanylate cyclase (GGDEF)-like protein
MKLSWSPARRRLTRAAAAPAVERVEATGRAWSVPLFAGAIVLAAVALWPLLPSAPAEGSVHLPWWALALTFVVAEAAPIKLYFRRESQSFTLTEIPLLLGIFFLPPWQLLLVRGVVDFAFYAFVRRQTPVKLTFNLAAMLVETQLALLVAGALVGSGGSITSGDAGAAFAAMLAGTILTNVLIFVVISLTECDWQPRTLLRTLQLATVVTVVDTSLAVAAAVLVWRDATLTWLLAGPVAILGLSYRAYLGERRKHETMRFLYETTQDLQRATDVDAATGLLLAHARRIFRAGRAELLLEGKRTVMDADGTIRSQPVERPVPGAFDMRAALLADGREVGTLVVGDRPQARFDAHEQQLFETLAGHAGVSLEVIALGERLRHQALHDSMTGLANRAVFHDRLEHALVRAERRQRPVAVLVLDLDDFKTVNDSLGHTAGDELLVTVARRLRASLREGDTCARLGGDEFGVLLEDCGDPDDVLAVAEAVSEALRQPLMLEGREVLGTASIGAAVGQPGQRAEELLRNADLAMYRAKAGGSGLCRLFEGGMDALALRRLELRRDLQAALDGGELALQYQPVVALATGAITGVEALLRWRHPARGLVPPGEFVPLAEETGLIVPIGQWVLDEALRQLVAWDADLPAAPTTLSVNLSAVQLQRPQLVGDVRRSLERAGVDPRRLTLELTESIFMADLDATVATLNGLKGLGVQVAIDDFGTGYSSLGYLARLPLDVLKIAKPFVDAIKDGPQNDELAEAIVRIGESLGLTTLAEGIEVEAQLEHLRELRCELGQGFLFARPLDPGAVAELLRAGTALQAA